MSNYLTSFKKCPDYKWWRPLLFAVLAVVLWVVFQLVTLVLVGVVRNSVAPEPTSVVIDAGFDVSVEELLGQVTQSSSGAGGGTYLGMDYTSPFGMLASLLPIATGIPAVALALRLSKMGRLGEVSSHKGRLDLKGTFVYGGVALAIALPFIIVLALVQAGPQAFEGIRVHPAALLAIVLAAPLQAAGEEYIFRGACVKVLGSWIPSAIVVLIIQALAFSALHGYNLLGNISVAISGLVMGFLAYKTGGLEASIGLHAANNTAALVMASLFASMAVGTDTSVTELVVDVAFQALMCVALCFVAKKRGALVA